MDRNRPCRRFVHVLCLPVWALLVWAALPTKGDNCVRFDKRLAGSIRVRTRPNRVIRHEIIGVFVNVSESEPCVVDLCEIPGQAPRVPRNLTISPTRAPSKLTSFNVRCNFRGFLWFRLGSCFLGQDRLTTFHIFGCEVGVSNLHMLWKTFGITDVNLHRSKVNFRRPRGNRNFTSTSLHSVTIVDTDLSEGLGVVFPLGSEYPDVYKLSLLNTSLEQLPRDLRNKFPRLQFLDLSGNQLTRLPDFPWNTQPLHFSRDLSDVDFFTKDGYRKFRLDLPRNTTARALVLDDNKITSIQNFTFGTHLHVLSVTNNGLLNISDNVFVYTRHLQHLNLSGNSLQFLPSVCPAGQCDLRTLDLRHNCLTKLSSDTFRGLDHMRYLDLAHNRLSEIDAGTFSRLESLVSLHLEYTNLRSLELNSLPSDSKYLTHIYLSHNPLTLIPPAVFEMPDVTYIDLSACGLTFDRLSETLHDIQLVSFIQHLLKEYSTRIENIRKLKEKATTRIRDYTRFVDLSDNNITTVPAPGSFNGSRDRKVELELKYRMLLVNYQLDLSGNPVSCDCHMAEFLNYIKDHTVSTGDDTFKGDEYFYRDWKCATPNEFSRQPALSQDPKDLYCAADLVDCPNRCSCSSFVGNRGYLVDCQNARQFVLPNVMPEKALDLRLSGNNITQLDYRSYLPELEALDVSNNSLSYIGPDVFIYLYNLGRLRLDYNALQDLPREITGLVNVTWFTLSNNPFRCDCRTLWMKSWLLSNQHRIADIRDVFCSKNDGTVARFLEVSDKDFVCDKQKDQSYFIAAMSVTAAMVLCVSLAVCSYIFRLEIRSLAYVSVQIRIFDEIKPPTLAEVMRTALLVSSHDFEFCQENLMPEISLHSDSITILPRDFIIGLTIADNVSFMIKHSYRMVAILSDALLQDELCVLTLQKAIAKAQSKKGYLTILIMEGFNRDDLAQKFPRLKRFTKVQRYQCIHSSDRLRKEKLSYLSSVPSASGAAVDEAGWWQKGLSVLPRTTRQCSHDVYLAHHDSDFQWAFRHLRAKLENEGFSTQIGDLEFTPGEPIQDNIDHSLASCRYVVLLLSEAFLTDEWALYILRIAYEMTLREGYNYLIVLRTEHTISVQDEDLSVYLNTHAHIKMPDSDWWEKLRHSLWKRPIASQPASTGLASVAEL